MARLAEDAAATIPKIIADFQGKDALFRLSDAFRSKEQQDRAHYDYTSGRKKAYSPPSGQSMHEAGRAIDVDLATLIHSDSVPKGYKVLKESEVRSVLKKYGWIPISNQGSEHTVDVKESWHFEFRGPFQKVYDSTLALTGNRSKAYTAMAKAAIKDLGVVSAPKAEPKPKPAEPEIDTGNGEALPVDTVTLTSTTELPSGEVTAETKEVAMTETSPTAKRLTLGAVITAAIGFIQQAWQTSQEATVSGIQFLMKRMPMVLLILGILLFAYWIWKKAQESRDARLKLVVDTNTDKSRDDVKIV